MTNTYNTETPPTLEIPLSQGLVALIDAADYPLIADRTWYANKLGRCYYAVSSGRKTRLRMHRVILGALPGQSVDHQNHNGLDNRRANLRLCTTSQNAANQRVRDNASGYKGVSWHKRARRWRARIQTSREIYLGSFIDPWDAAKAYNAAAIEYWGEFANLNVRIDAAHAGGAL